MSKNSIAPEDVFVQPPCLSEHRKMSPKWQAVFKESFAKIKRETEALIMKVSQPLVDWEQGVVFATAS
jgi:hypothetical protein